MKLTDGFYLILTPTRRSGATNPVTGQRPVVEFKTGQLRRGMPPTEAGEVAVRLNITIDSTVFEKAVPVIDVEINEEDVFVNTTVSVESSSPE